MATKWLDGLDAKTQGFLIATLLFQSKDSGALFSLLDQEDSVVLNERARILFGLERGHRVRLLVNELKRQHFGSPQPWILAVHPSWLVAILEKEKEPIQRLALAALPASLRASLAKTLGIVVVHQEFPEDLLRAARVEVEKHFVPMRMDFQLLELTKEELAYIVSKSGIEALAFFLANQPKNVQREVAQRLEYTLGQRLVKCAESGEHSDVDFRSIVAQAAHEGRIDRRFSVNSKTQ